MLLAVTGLLLGLAAGTAIGLAAGSAIPRDGRAAGPPSVTGRRVERPAHALRRVVDIPDPDTVVVDVAGQRVPVEVLGIDPSATPTCAAAGALGFARRTLTGQPVTLAGPDRGARTGTPRVRRARLPTVLHRRRDPGRLGDPRWLPGVVPAGVRHRTTSRPGRGSGHLGPAVPGTDQQPRQMTRTDPASPSGGRLRRGCGDTLTAGTRVGVAGCPGGGPRGVAAERTPILLHGNTVNTANTAVAPRMSLPGASSRRPVVVSGGGSIFLRGANRPACG